MSLSQKESSEKKTLKSLEQKKMRRPWRSSLKMNLSQAMKKKWRMVKKMLETEELNGRGILVAPMS